MLKRLPIKRDIPLGGAPVDMAIGCRSRGIPDPRGQGFPFAIGLHGEIHDSEPHLHSALGKRSFTGMHQPANQKEKKKTPEKSLPGLHAQNLPRDRQVILAHCL